MYLDTIQIHKNVSRYSILYLPDTFWTPLAARTKYNDYESMEKAFEFSGRYLQCVATRVILNIGILNLISRQSTAINQNIRVLPQLPKQVFKVQCHFKPVINQGILSIQVQSAFFQGEILTSLFLTYISLECNQICSAKPSPMRKLN